MADAVLKFNVVSAEGGTVLPTEVHHHSDGVYELFSITQWDADTEQYCTVLVHREQLAAMAAIAKGH